MSHNETKEFLDKQLGIYEVSLGKRKLCIPTKSDRCVYKVAFLRRDQQQIVAIVLHNIYCWLYASNYEPLRMTISGVAGSGKSTLIQTLVSLVRILFQHNDVVHVCAPTGSAAFSAGGETTHHLFAIQIPYMNNIPTPTQRKKLMLRFSNIVVLIVDERSMVGSELLSIMESYARLTVHNAVNTNKPWGYIPVIILVGDDYQLPPIFQGAFESILPLQERVNQVVSKPGMKSQKRIAKGHLCFRELARMVMYLHSSQRVLSSQNWLARILEGLRAENSNTLNEDDIDFLTSNFHLMNPHFSHKDC